MMAENSSKGLNPGDIDLRIGNPRFLEDFWLNSACNVNGCGTYKKYTSYLNPKDLEHLRSNLHSIYRKSPSFTSRECEIVVGHGATSILAASLFAYRKVYNEGLVSIKSPHWSMFKGIVDVAGSKLHTAENEISEKYINIVTSPNNPDGAIHDISLEISDLSYCWPTYMHGHTVNPNLSPVKVFSFGKATGLVGLRLGWAVVSDKTLIKEMERFLEFTTGGLSVQTVHSGIDTSNFLLNNGEMEKLFTEGSDILTYRRLELQKSLAKHGMTDSSTTGMFSFINDEHGTLHKRGIIGIGSESFSTDKSVNDSLKNYTRISIGCSKDEFQSVLERLK